MAQQPVEIILLRQLASYLQVPIWLMDQDGNLLFYNQAAERLLGVSFDQAGPIGAGDIVDLFATTDLDGSALADEDLPVVHVLRTRQPAHRRIRFRGQDQVWREVEVSALPIAGQGGRFLGAYACFWETE